MKIIITARKLVVTSVIALWMGGITTLAAATASQLVFTVQPASTVIGTTFTNVVVQLRDRNGNNIAQSGVKIFLALSKGAGLTGTTNVTSAANGTAAFTNLKITQPGTNDTLLATASGMRNATSSAFNVNRAGSTVSLVSSTNFLVYSHSVTFTAMVKPVAPASGTPTGTVTFKNGTVTLGTAALNATGVASFSTNRLSALTASQTITGVYGGDGNFSGSTSSNFVQAVGPLALTATGVAANSKTYDGMTTVTLNFSNAVLATVLAGDTVTLNSAAASGAFTSKTVGTNKTVSISGLTLAGASAGNYFLVAPTVTASILPRNLGITAQGVNKIYDGTTNATVTLADNRLAGDAFTNSYKSATFVSRNVGAAILINVSGLAIGGADAGNYALTNLSATASANITSASLVVSGILASNKIYDATTAAVLNFSGAKLAPILGGDVVALNATNAKGAFASKTVGTGKNVTVSGLALAGTGAGNYTLTLPVTTTASITARGLTLTAKGVNKIYDGTTAATVTLTDNRVAGDALTDSYGSAE